MTTDTPAAIVTPLRNHILAAFPREALDGVAPHLRLLKMKVGQVLYDVGDDVDRVYFFESGLITIVTSMRSGRDIETTSRGRDGGLGYLEATGGGVMSSRALVQIRGEALCLAASRYRELCEASPAVRAQMNRRTEILLADARQASACRVAHATPARFARMLLECVHHMGHPRLRLTQEFMAGMIGAGRTTVNQAACQLQDQGLISYRRGVLTVLDEAGLRSRACECYSTLR